MPIPPLVTGVSPKEGPPGTRITIRGENLGKDPKDLIGLKICGVNCLLSAEWKTSSKIIARTGPGKGKGDIIVTTGTGGVGSSTVGFRGYFIQIGPLQESAIWIDESQTVMSNLGRGRASSPMLIKDDEDPLGLSDEGTQKKFKEDELLELFPEASGNMSLENFSPAWYLLENHHSTSFDDLKAGLAHMKRKATQRSEGPIAFVKSNLSSTIDCLSSLAAMNRMFVDDDIRGECMNSYAVLLMQAKSCADGLFQEVLGRRDKADSTRNALSVLQRFKFLFYLPLNIERNIQKGDYNLVINDYVRARSLFADTQVPIFKKVYKEVEERVHSFRKMLHQKLLELPNSLEEQKKLIRYLVNLESGGDPAWECLNNQQNWLMTMLSQCRDEHITEGRKNKKQEVDSPIQRKNCPMSPRQTGYTPAKTSGQSSSQDQSAMRFKTPQKVLFIEELNDIVTENFPDFWKLGNAYFAGSLLHKETGDKPFKIDSNKHSQFKQMISEVINFFTNLVRAAFLPESLENLPHPEREKYGIWPESKQDLPFAWLPHCVRCVRSCVSSLSSLDLPSVSTELIQELAFDMRTHCMFTLLEQAITEVKSLHSKETWAVESDDEYGGTTQLPALFENIVNETIQHLHEVVIQNRSGECKIFSQCITQKEATTLCIQLLQAFAVCLQKLAFMQHHICTDSNKSDPQSDLDDAIPPLDKCLIIMLSNCNHTCQRVIPRLIENLDKHGYVEMDKCLEMSQAKYLELDHRLFEAYIEEKSNPIVGVMEQNMYRGCFDWNTCGRPIGVRNYLKEVLMGMIEVHAEVYAISPSFVSRVMCKVVEAVAEELSRLILCSTGFNTNGSLQARLELTALQDAVIRYRTDGAMKHFQEGLAILPPVGPNKKMMDELLNKHKSQMQFQLMCFQTD